MQSSPDILQELNEISTLVAAIEKVNVFAVPNGYFENLSDIVLVNVQQDGMLLNAVANRAPIMEVPQGYFDSLAGNILNRIKIAEAGNADIALSPLLQSLQQQNVFTVPQGYFETLADTVVSKIAVSIDAATELKALSPVLYSIQNENVFSVPQGYFENLATIMLRKVEPVQAKVVTMKRRNTSAVLKYAIAAVFTGVMALGVYKFTNSSNAKVIVPDYVAQGQQIKNVDGELEKVTDDDIIKYLQANGESVDAQALAANVVNADELPTQDDYLTDDKALDNFLDNVNLNDLKN